MVDFAVLLDKLKTWKKRRLLVGCSCTSEMPVSCYQWSYDTDAEFACKCKCHQEELPKRIYPI